MISPSVSIYPFIHPSIYPCVHLPQPSLSIYLSTYSGIHPCGYFLNATFLNLTLRPPEICPQLTCLVTVPTIPSLTLHLKTISQYLWSMNLQSSHLNILVFVSGCLLFCSSLGLNSVHPSRPSSGTTSSSTACLIPHVDFPPFWAFTAPQAPSYSSHWPLNTSYSSA